MLPGGEASVSAGANAVRVMTNMIDCSLDYLRTDQVNAHAYSTMEAFTLMHGIIEVKEGLLERGWNVIPADLFAR